MRLSYILLTLSFLIFFSCQKEIIKSIQQSESSLKNNHPWSFYDIGAPFNSNDKNLIIAGNHINFATPGLDRYGKFTVEIKPTIYPDESKSILLHKIRHAITPKQIIALLTGGISQDGLVKELRAIHYDMFFKGKMEVNIFIKQLTKIKEGATKGDVVLYLASIEKESFYKIDKVDRDRIWDAFEDLCEICYVILPSIDHGKMIPFPQFKYLDDYPKHKRPKIVGGYTECYKKIKGRCYKVDYYLPHSSTVNYWDGSKWVTTDIEGNEVAAAHLAAIILANDPKYLVFKRGRFTRHKVSISPLDYIRGLRDEFDEIKNGHIPDQFNLYDYLEFKHRDEDRKRKRTLGK